MTSNFIQLATHSIFAIIWCSSLYYDIHYLPRLMGEVWAKKLVMLTNINFILFVGYSVISLFFVLTKWKFLRNVVDFYFYTSIFPVGMTTVALFWGLYAIEPELVMPAWVAALIPNWLNHVTHTLPAVHLLIDLLSNHHTPPTRFTLKVMAFVLVAVYFKIIFYVRYYDGYWLYPVLELFHPIMHIFTYLGAVFGYFSLCCLATFVTRKIHGEKRKVG
ncbi:unnamed protein product, partial [Mesorhabditis belari]|uniref:Androgen-dependent TFPI-regulating protein n=1 Tax=Mesorhabditis belari TaxID=2138241 RepID=A0AAF3JB61_9BILA